MHLVFVVAVMSIGLCNRVVGVTVQAECSAVFQALPAVSELSQATLPPQTTKVLLRDCVVDFAFRLVLRATSNIEFLFDRCRIRNGEGIVFEAEANSNASSFGMGNLTVRVLYSEFVNNAGDLFSVSDPQILVKGLNQVQFIVVESTLVSRRNGTVMCIWNTNNFTPVATNIQFDVRGAVIASNDDDGACALGFYNVPTVRFVRIAVANSTILSNATGRGTSLTVIAATVAWFQTPTVKTVQLRAFTVDISESSITTKVSMSRSGIVALGGAASAVAAVTSAASLDGFDIVDVIIFLNRVNVSMLSTIGAVGSIGLSNSRTLPVLTATNVTMISTDTVVRVDAFNTIAVTGLVVSGQFKSTLRAVVLDARAGDIGIVATAQSIAVAGVATATIAIAGTINVNAADCHFRLRGTQVSVVGTGSQAISVAGFAAYFTHVSSVAVRNATMTLSTSRVAVNGALSVTVAGVTSICKSSIAELSGSLSNASGSIVRSAVDVVTTDSTASVVGLALNTGGGDPPTCNVIDVTFVAVESNVSIRSKFGTAAVLALILNAPKTVSIASTLTNVVLHAESSTINAASSDNAADTIVAVLGTAMYSWLFPAVLPKTSSNTETCLRVYAINSTIFVRSEAGSAIALGTLTQMGTKFVNDTVESPLDRVVCNSSVAVTASSKVGVSFGAVRTWDASFQNASLPRWERRVAIVHSTVRSVCATASSVGRSCGYCLSGDSIGQTMIVLSALQCANFSLGTARLFPSITLMDAGSLLTNPKGIGLNGSTVLFNVSSNVNDEDVFGDVTRNSNVATMCIRRWPSPLQAATAIEVRPPPKSRTVSIQAFAETTALRPMPTTAVPPLMTPAPIVSELTSTATATEIPPSTVTVTDTASTIAALKPTRTRTQQALTTTATAPSNKFTATHWPTPMPPANSTTAAAPAVTTLLGSPTMNAAQTSISVASTASVASAVLLDTAFVDSALEMQLLLFATSRPGCYGRDARDAAASPPARLFAIGTGPAKWTYALAVTTTTFLLIHLAFAVVKRNKKQGGDGSLIQQLTSSPSARWPSASVSWLTVVSVGFAMDVPPLAGDSSIAFVVAATFCAAPVLLHVAIWRHVQRAIATKSALAFELYDDQVLSATTRSAVLRPLLPKGRWGPTAYRRAFGAVFASYLPGWRSAFGIGALFRAVVIAAVASIPPPMSATAEFCRAQSFALAAASMLFSIANVVAAPRRAAAVTPALALSSILTGAIFAAPELLDSKTQSGEVVGYLSIAASIVGFSGIIVSATIVAIEKKLGKRQRALRATPPPPMSALTTTPALSIPPTSDNAAPLLASVPMKDQVLLPRHERP